MRAVKPYIISKSYIRERNLRILYVSIGVIILSGGIIGSLSMKDFIKNTDTTVSVPQVSYQVSKESASPSKAESPSIATEKFISTSVQDTTSPTVISVSPVSGSTGVAINSIITATFSEAMDASTINPSTFTIRNGGINVDGIVSYRGMTAAFTPLNRLLSSTVYTATITTGIKDLAGNAIAFNFVWSFTTVSVPTTSKPPAVASKPKEEGSQQTSMLTSIYPENGMSNWTAILLSFRLLKVEIVFQVVLCMAMLKSIYQEKLIMIK